MTKVEERPKKPVITFGTMGTAHSVRDYGAGPSGVNDTGAHLNMFSSSFVVLLSPVLKLISE